jgi:hypothetical protein
MSDNEINAPVRHNFTVIKLRPVSIQLNAANGDYDALNVQALEFEAAFRQWLGEQQILTEPQWQIDVLTED